MKTIQREITPLNKDDLFIVLNHHDADFDYATHFHSDYELNLILNDNGRRIVGDLAEEFSDCDLVLIGSNLPHSWKGEKIKGNHVITMQFDADILTYPILQKNIFQSIRELLQRANRGIQFVEKPDAPIFQKIINLCSMSGFNVVLEFLSILYNLSISPNQRFLASKSFDCDEIIRESKSRRILKICNYINENYMHQMRLSDISALVGMSDSALSHFFKRRTNRSIIEYINDIRIGNASKMLFETTHSVNEIAYLCGFNNTSNFNRIFKNYKKQTPSELRKSIQKILVKY